MPLFLPPFAQKIASFVFTGAESTVTFSNIPQIYQHLRLMGTLKTSQTATTFTNCFVRVNGDSGTTYDRQRLIANDSTAASSAAVDQMGASLIIVSANVGVPAGEATDLDLHILNYTSAFRKHIKSSFSYRNADTAAGQGMLTQTDYWNGTAAITSISFTEPTPANMVAGSRLDLYGIF